MRSILFPALAALSVSLLGGCSREEAAVPTAAVPVETVQEADPAYLASIEQWRSERADRLRDPDGWLSFAGSGQVAVGAHSVGSARDDAIVLPKGPAKWGVLHLSADGGLRFDAAPESGLTIDGKTFGSAPLLTQRDEGGPTRIAAGRQYFYVVKTGDLYGWRFRDPESPALQAFAGIPHFPVDRAWRIEADWRPYPALRTLQLVTTNGTLEPADVPGQAEFERDGKRHVLLPVVQEDSEQLFFIIADRTSGKQTYGGARFLYADPPRDGRIVLDFNKAQNPPCALNGHVVCPTAPPENRLDLAVAAGEQTYPLAH
ncbi:DUF1684 domain-containing protein [Pseudoxanthomonas putridarboris]|uniref:DUF1684 domain-containing protein n=1 Tax=Pseudoxanthomonas putridarboris TaxID=752605 RepID=A0ABU9IYB9_9GAMM